MPSEFVFTDAWPQEAFMQWLDQVLGLESDRGKILMAGVKLGLLVTYTALKD